MTRAKDPDYQALFLADLARSGLTANDAKRLRLRLLDPRATEKLTMTERGPINPSHASYRIPYLDPRGKDTGFFRLRFLGTLSPKAPRYWQPKGSLPQLFFPPIDNLAQILKDPQVPLYVTEGEKKAYRACRDGIVTLGVGGVWSWKSQRAETPSGAIKDLDFIEWKKPSEGRDVFIVFDSDTSTNPQVQAAVRAFAKEMTNRGAYPRQVKLPPGPQGIKVGLDDFLEAETKEAFEALEKTSPVGSLPNELWRLNEDVALVLETGMIWEFSTRHYLTDAQFKNIYGDRIVTIYSEQGKSEKVVEREWRRWNQKKKVPRVVFEPAEAPNFTSAGDINLWRGWAVDPKPGSVKPWDDLLTYIFNGDAAARSWFEDWCAYPLQHPGTKLYTAVVFYSIDHGVGKSILGETLVKIYGDGRDSNGSNAATTPTPEQLASQFNGWAAQKLFALCNEVTGSDRRRDADRFKNLVTQEVVTVNEKYQPTYTLKDRLNYFFTTNHPDALFLERKDRRFFIHEIQDPPKPQAFYNAYNEWKDGAGPSHLFHALLKRNLSNFNPRAAAPLTDAKTEMIRSGFSDLDDFADQLRRDPDATLRLDGQPVTTRSLVTLAELLEYADPAGRRGTTKAALGKALRRAEFRPLKLVRLTTGVTQLWAVRDQGKWLKADPEAVKAEREKGTPKLAVVKKEKF